MEMRDQLQSALGGTYTIERELGGGGMSRVFAATDTALGRRVVIKMVPSDLAATVNVDRFKREIQLAASLQHPQIVPVLTAGEIDGVPYYTMPFVEGESLRERIGRGPVPLTEAINLLRDVARALAYAHERGVVHRDIKPDNVLISGGSAAVADFGIAKAIEAAGKKGGDSRSTNAGLTQVGMSIGTPMYMAPEQAAADPDTDHRADIYSFGCLAYELLTGRPPFKDLPPHKLLVAHMTERPQPIGSLRDDIPRALGDLVMRCLEKDPSARPQSAAEIVKELDAVTSTPSFEVPSPALRGEGAFWKVAVGYFVALLVIAGFTRAAIVRIGLPDWVLPGLIVLLAVGFPVVVAATYFRGLSWRRSLVFGLAGLGVFVLGVAGFMRMRDSGIGPFGSLLGAGKLNRRDKILVADFQSKGADTTLGGVVSEAVRADLGQSPIISVVTPQTVASALQRMQLPENTRVDTAVARQIARREGVKAIIEGEVHAITGGGFVLTMQLVSADSGQELASVQASADATKDLIPTIGRLTRRLRSKMGESLKHLQGSPELAQVTTSSLPALEAYTAGQYAMNVKSDLSAAIPLFRTAVKLDTSFAMAYRALAVALGNRNQDREERVRSMEKAFAHTDRLPEVERYLTVATYYTQGPKPDDAKAIAAYDTLLKLRPNQYAALNNLALLYAKRRDFVKAAESARQSIAASPTSLTAYRNLIVYQAELGRLAGVESTYAAELKESGNLPRVAVERASFLYARGEYDAAAALVDSVAHANPGEADLTQTALAMKAAIAVTRGQINEGLKLTSQNIEITAKNGSPTARLSLALNRAIIDGFIRESKEKALADLEAGVAQTPLSTIQPLDRPYVGLAQVYAIAGRPDRAREMLAEFEKTTEGIAPDVVQATRHQLLSAIALSERRYADAAREARAGDIGTCTICMLPLMGIAYDNAQQPDSAISVLTRYVESTALSNRTGSNQFFLAGSYKRLGELWEAKGNREKAAHYYGLFVDLWKNADADLQPKVAEVRKRLARLSDTEAKR
jgi:tetratricopeptide (TPR) repeat protein/tRNA A-37 threonylcarbamoyl transferase component Bud32/TolB-like protein